jgi:hypothetical protein
MAQIDLDLADVRAFAVTAHDLLPLRGLSS